MAKKINKTAWVFISIAIALIAINLATQITDHTNNSVTIQRVETPAVNLSDSIALPDSIWQNTEFTVL